MIEANMPNLSVEEIMKKIKEEVKQDENRPKMKPLPKNSTANLPLHHIKPFVKKPHYEIADFAKYHDEEFVRNLYIGILKREPDANGFAHHLDILRNGLMSKTELIIKMRYSKEGKEKKVKILGLKKRRLAKLLRNVPILGYIIKLLMLPLITQKQTTRLNALEAQSFMHFKNYQERDINLQNVINKKLDTDIHNINNENMHIKLENKVDKEEMAFLYAEVNDKAERYELEPLQEELCNKINADVIEALQEALEGKINKEEIETLREELGNKADVDIVKTVQEALGSKINKEEIETLREELGNKANTDTIKTIQETLEGKINKEDIETLYKEMATKTDKKEFELYLKTVQYAKEYMQLSSEKMQNLIDEAKKRLPKKVFEQNELKSLADEENHKYDELYVRFEDKFRGTSEDIKSRVEIYLPYIEKLPFEKDEVEVLDIGCGRGEWLELLGENGYKAKGVDLNRIMVSHCQKKRLDAINQDALEYMRTLEPNSLSMISGFHIIEHLPFDILMQLYKESHRVLKKGGMVLFETPNPENIIVGACNFYTDPTHINPIPPVVTNFILTECGFSKCDTLELYPVKTPDYLKGNDINEDINTVLYRFFKEQDYATIGHKI